MGYNIYIGNATPYHEKYEDELEAGWTVVEMEHDDAPTFVGDETTGKTNGRHPSYIGWGGFTEAVGLYDLFYNKWTGLMRKCHGCVPLTQAHADEITAALTAYPRTKPPGFSEDGSMDYNLARLLWLGFWVRYALANCETPAMRS